ncbi:MAG: dienelactone hydrolase family protein [Alphaproteobacteria bacterium]|nr:dienelactone hydrolase family protein [Alphaproteobacteria bacterium]
MSDVSIRASDGGEFSAYLAKPKASTAPGLVLIQEIFGVNKEMREKADRFAKAGFLVACPDLFWRQEPGIQLTDQSQEEWDQAFALYQGFNEAKGVQDLIATLFYLRNLPECQGGVGAVGYCLGGKLAYLMATRSDADCSVSYYGVGIEGALEEANAILRPLMLHIAEADQFVSKEAQAEIKRALHSRTFVTIHSYPKVDHAFAREKGVTYNQEAAELANQRTFDFLKEHLA